MLRERTRQASPAPNPTTAPDETDIVTIDRVKIAGGAFVAANARDRIEHRIDNINADAVIDAVCWRMTAVRLGIKPEDGMEVLCTGRLTTFPGRSKYQLVIDSMELAGVGALLKLLEDRRKRLAAEGLIKPNFNVVHGNDIKPDTIERIVENGGTFTSTAEIELLPFCRAAGLGVIPWGPLGAGFLTGKYERDTPPPPGSRMAGASDDLEEAVHRRAIERNFRVVDEARAIAEARGVTIPQVAIAWLLGTDGVTAPIVGARTYEQLEDLLPAAELTIWPDNTTIFDRLAAGDADVMVTDAVEAIYQSSRHPGLAAVHPDAPFTSEAKAYLLPKGSPIAAATDAWLAGALNDGTFAASYQRWLHAPAPAPPS